MKIETNNIVNNRSLHLAVSVGMVEFHTSHDFGGEPRTLFTNRIENKRPDVLRISEAMSQVLTGVSNAEHDLDLASQGYQNANLYPLYVHDARRAVEDLVERATRGIRLLRAMCLQFSGSQYRHFYPTEFGHFVDSVIRDLDPNRLASQLREAFDVEEPFAVYSQLDEFYSAAAATSLSIQGEPMFHLLSDDSKCAAASVAWKLLREILRSKVLVSNADFIRKYQFGLPWNERFASYTEDEDTEQVTESPTRFGFGALLLLAPIIGWHEYIRAEAINDRDDVLHQPTIIKPVPWVEEWFRSGRPLKLSPRFAYHTEGRELL